MQPHPDEQEDPIQQQCRHIKPDGHRCGSPSLREQNFCFYHRTARRCGPRQPQVQTATARKSSTFDLPSPADLSDRSGIQLAVALLLHKIAHNEIDPRRAGLLLYGLQTAAMLLPKEFARNSPKKPYLQPEPVDDIIEDPLHGPLAPPCELGANDPETTLQRIAREIREETAADAAAKAAAAAIKAQAAAEAASSADTSTQDPSTQKASVQDLSTATSRQPPGTGPHIPPSCFHISAAAAQPPSHKPNRACRRQTKKQHRRQTRQPAGSLTPAA